MAAAPVEWALIASDFIAYALRVAGEGRLSAGCGSQVCSGSGHALHQVNERIQLPQPQAIPLMPQSTLPDLRHTCQRCLAARPPGCAHRAGTAAVSYTHLDVYKRQGLSRVRYQDTEHYQVSRDFLANPERMLKVLLER